ncbi:DUF192 domain-containing protein [Dendronalium sp. ChiSLP03b]|uniref:DUF192 domain-containing protein n=1 Tax=Dendronalium sp. ChiSLP03b TaxID=3075381 RepID=UPI002AD2A212|nr:DUF192 domain-containing protein [Dendronalium sp. ChiSLP03b]MDZ8203514.1 DUF192 domain-containing protein [Dendronalium sp. ChiSLP03b]
MQLRKIRSQNDLFGEALKLLNFLGPVAGVSIIVASTSICYLQTRPQHLPVTHTLTHNRRTFQLEVATTAEELEKGLKFRSSLRGDRGMLFILGREYKDVPFWMSQVKIHLDIIFLKDNVVTTVVYNAPPCTENPCPIYKGRVATSVLELTPGAAKIRVGDRLNIQPVLPKNDIGFDSKTPVAGK